MVVVRLLLFLALAAIGVSLVLYLIRRDRRYLRFIRQVLVFTLIILAAVLLLFAAEQALDELEQRPCTRCISLISGSFYRLFGRLANLHAHPYFSKVPTLAPQGREQVRSSLSHDRGNRTGARGKLQAPGIGGGHPHVARNGARQVGPQRRGEARLDALLPQPIREHRVALEDLCKG